MKPGKAPLAVAAGQKRASIELKRQARQGWGYLETFETPQARNRSRRQEQDSVHVL